MRGNSGADDRWRVARADEHSAEAPTVGITAVAVLRDVDDPSSIWIVGDGEPDKFNEMMQDPGLAAAMQEAGVTGPPQVYRAP